MKAQVAEKIIFPAKNQTTGLEELRE